MRVASSDPHVRALLAGHPRVTEVAVGDDPLAWNQGPWSRRVLVGRSDVAQYGLVELMDNNPIVCADELSVPSPSATLALIALGPLAAGGLILERPTLVVSAEVDELEIDRALETMGWSEGVIVQHEAVDIGSAVAATAMAAIPSLDDPTEVPALYEERFGRSFFVHEDRTSNWDPSLVLGSPRSVYRLRLLPDEPQSLLTVRALADLQGKAGATQIVHAFNVMCGFEESLGIPGS